jgi:hypothetical protein
MPAGEHLNHALADHGELAVGRAARSALPVAGVTERKLPPASAREPFAAPKGPAE